MVVTPERHNLANDLLRRTLQLTPTQRSDYLKTVCGEDHELSDHINALLASQSETTTRLEPKKIVRRIGRYEIEGPLGAGGMGVVYLARDTALDRKVAIKSIYSASAESATQQLRLMREAKAAGALSHPHIATVYDVFDDQGSTYIVMEYIAGASVAGTIAELPQGRTMPPETALRIVRQTASALDYAHEQGIIHRDIKPANLLLDHHGSVKVVDFGIAKMADSNTDLTHGAPIGTVAYMSPEQINSEPLTGRADQFSLAATAYVLFAGQPLFPQAETISSLMFKNCFEQPMPVSAVKFGLPQTLDEALARGLAKKASERFTTCAEFAAGCDRAFQNPVTTAPLPLVDPAPKPKTGVIVWSLMVLAGILVAVLMTMSRPSAPSAPGAATSTTAVPAESPTTVPTNIPPATKPGTKEPLERSVAQNKNKEKAGKDQPVLMARNDLPKAKSEPSFAEPERPKAPAAKSEVKEEPALVERTKPSPQRQADPLRATERSTRPTNPSIPYTGPDSGQFVWTGALNAGDSVTISGVVPEVSGTYLPGVAVQLEVVPPLVTVVTAPSASNKFKSVVLKNTSGRTQNLIIVKWKVTP